MDTNASMLEKLRSRLPGRTVDAVFEADFRWHLLVDGRRVSLRWNPSAVDDLKRMHGLDAEDEAVECVIHALSLGHVRD